MKHNLPRRLTLSLVLSGVLISSASVSYAQAIVHQITLPSGESWCDDSMINGLLSEINLLRSQDSVPAIQMNTLGMLDAEERAVQFAAYMAVNTPSTPGFDPHTGYNTTAASLGYNLYSEDLAYMTTSPAYIVYTLWQDSLHLDPMVNKAVTVAGVSCIYAQGTAYWTYEPAYSGNSTSPTPTPTPTPTPAPTPTPTPTPGGTPTMTSDEITFLSLLNTYRSQNGAGPLQVSIALQNSSAWMANDMATNNYSSHTDSLGRSPATRLADFGYPYTPWGENIAGGYNDAQSVLTGWINACDPDSTGACTYAHRANMLNSSFVVIGIGEAYNASSTYGWYWDTDFGGVLDATLNPTNPTSAPTISAFTATPSTITAGQSSTLAWTVTGTGVTVSINNGVGTVTTSSKAVSPAQTTTYTLTAANTSGSTTATVTMTVNPKLTGGTPPTAPVITSSSAKSSTEIDLGWSASTDAAGVTGYQILRNGSPINTVSGTTLTFADTTVSPSTTYSYSVKAFDAAGNYSAASNSVSVTTPASSCPGPATNAFTGCYYANTTLSGAPVLVRTDNQINFAWGGSSPSPAVPAEDFSVRWQGNFTFSQGTYTFTVVTSDGMQLYVDGNMILNYWKNQPPYEYTVQQTLTQGTHLITVEYYEQTGGATADVAWKLTSGGSTGSVPVISSFSPSPAISWRAKLPRFRGTFQERPQ